MSYLLLFLMLIEKFIKLYYNFLEFYITLKYLLIFKQFAVSFLINSFLKYSKYLKIIKEI